MGEPIRMMPGEAPRRSSNTCLIGCIGSIVAACVLMFVGVLVAVYAFGQLRDQLTSDAPEPLPEVQFTPEHARRVQQQVQALEAALQGNTQGPAGIELTGYDLNVLLHSDPRFYQMADKLYLDIVEDTLSAQVSVPLSMFPGMEGRWLNGAAAVDLNVVHDQFVLSIRQFNVHGVQFPPQALGQFEAEINKNLNQDPEIRALAARIGDIAVEKGRIRITFKGGQS